LSRQSQKRIELLFSVHLEVLYHTSSVQAINPSSIFTMSADASSSSAPGGDAAPAEQSHPYTLETLKAHNTREDLWMLLHGKVYNVTKFLDEVSARRLGQRIVPCYASEMDSVRRELLPLRE
jgi:hypothetical protein